MSRLLRGGGILTRRELDAALRVLSTLRKSQPATAIMAWDNDMQDALRGLTAVGYVETYRHPAPKKATASFKADILSTTPRGLEYLTAIQSAPAPARHHSTKRKPSTAMSEFETAYEELSQVGACDSPGGAEYRRVKHEWVEAGRPADVQRFIRVRANWVPPFTQAHSTIRKSKRQLDAEIAASLSSQNAPSVEGYRVAYGLVTRRDGKVVTVRAIVDAPRPLTLAEAEAWRRTYGRSHTAWVETMAGKHVPVAGAKRPGKFVDDARQGDVHALLTQDR